jgi:LmbE family N-acetylglucosaminyl deacetylase
MRWLVLFVIAALAVLFGNSISDTQDVFFHELLQPFQSKVHNALGTQGELEIPIGLRLLLFSPHPDDESIAAGGLIQRVLENEGKVRVVFVTNGDGYVEGVQLSVKRSKISAGDFIIYGDKRHNEAVKAITALGLQAEDGIFLGFPDQGIDSLWGLFWSKVKPYTSPYTRFNHPRYKTSLNQWVRYDGADLDSELQGIIKNFAPQWIVLPDPRDYHPDHSATGIFVIDALRRLNAEGSFPLSDAEVLTYLVHYPDYPTSNAWIKRVQSDKSRNLRDSRVLSKADWLSFTLTAEEIEKKKDALSTYGTQQQVLGGFLKQSIRPSETFGLLDVEKLATPQDARPDR